MIYLLGRSLSIVVALSIAQHLFWVGMILFDLHALNATGLHALYKYIQPPQFLAFTLAISSLSAIVGIMSRLPWLVILLIPQQILLMMSAAGVVEAIYLGQFADGVLRPQAFIASDQIGTILFAIGHTTAMIVHTRRLGR